MSPHFCYRMDPATARGERASSVGGPATRRRPLSDYDLASRLSYFLWSSMPDEELMTLAAAGDLQKPDVLTTAGPADVQDSARPRPGPRVRR